MRQIEAAERYMDYDKFLTTVIVGKSFATLKINRNVLVIEDWEVGMLYRYTGSEYLVMQCSDGSFKTFYLSLNSCSDKKPNITIEDMVLKPEVPLHHDRHARYGLYNRRPHSQGDGSALDDKDRLPLEGGSLVQVRVKEHWFSPPHQKKQTYFELIHKLPSFKAIELRVPNATA